MKKIASLRNRTQKNGQYVHMSQEDMTKLTRKADSISDRLMGVCSSFIQDQVSEYRGLGVSPVKGKNSDIFFTACVSFLGSVAQNAYLDRSRDTDMWDFWRGARDFPATSVVLNKLKQHLTKAGQNNPKNSQTMLYLLSSVEALYGEGAEGFVKLLK